MNNINNALCKALFFSIVFLLSAIAASAGDLTENLPSNLMELSIEQLMDIEVPTIYGASKYEQKVVDAPSSVSIITASEIKNTVTGLWPTSCAASGGSMSLMIAITIFWG